MRMARYSRTPSMQTPRNRPHHEPIRAQYACSHVLAEAMGALNPTPSHPALEQLSSDLRALKRGNNQSAGLSVGVSPVMIQVVLWHARAGDSWQLMVH